MAPRPPRLSRTRLPASRRAVRVVGTGVVLLGLLLGLLLGAGSAPTAHATPGVERDPSDRLFDTSMIHEVRFGLSGDALARLRASCTAWERVVSQDPACDERVPAQLSVDGVVVDDAGVRLKGGIATWRPLGGKPSFSVETDEFVADQELFGEQRFTVNNTIGDPSFVAETLTYEVFRAAGIPAPRTALANVYVNDEHFGLYVLREHYDQRFLDRNFGDDDGNLYESTTPARDLADPALWPRTNEDSPDHHDLEQLAMVVQSVPDPWYRAALGQLVDLSSFYRYWAVEALTAHIDGYLYNMAAIGREESPWPNNFYVYHDPTTDKFVVLPWGADATFGAGFTPVPPDTPTLLPPKAASTMAVRLWALPGTSERVRRTMLSVLESAWDEAELLRLADELAELVRADGLTGDRETVTPEEFEATFSARRAFVVERPPAVRAELAPVPAGPPSGGG